MPCLRAFGFSLVLALPASAEMPETVVFVHEDIDLARPHLLVTGFCMARIDWPDALTSEPARFQISHVYPPSDAPTVIARDGATSVYVATRACFEAFAMQMPEGSLSETGINALGE